MSVKLERYGSSHDTYILHLDDLTLSLWLENLHTSLDEADTYQLKLQEIARREKLTVSLSEATFDARKL